MLNERWNRVSISAMLFPLSLWLFPASSAGQGLRMLSDPTVIKRTPTAPHGNEIAITLNVEYADHQIYNPTTGLNDKVHLRSYNKGLIGPTIRMKPGDLLKLALINKLPKADPSCPGTVPDDPNVPNCYNTTNLHTHGLHISPEGNSDNVLLALGPDSRFDYDFHPLEDHPAGTFWYHSHRHGSTALQVSSGMVGALIVEGSRPARAATPGSGDIDTILKYADGKPFDEHVLVFEQIAYACGVQQDGTIVWDCKPGQIGDIEGYGKQFGPGTWPGSGRYTLINGVVQPTWTAQTGRIQRWRMIHGGVRDTVNFKIVKSKQPANLLQAFGGARALSLQAQKNWVDQNCLVDQPVSQWEFAVDGLTRPSFAAKQINVFQPGYRSDILALFNDPGLYCVLDEQASATVTINQQAKDRRLLGLIRVTGAAVSGDPRAYLISQLTAANSSLPAPVTADLKNLKLTAYTPHAPIPGNGGIGHQSLAFNVDVTTKPRITFEICNQNCLPYDPDRIDRLLKLNTVDEWDLTSKLAAHPFHIHVNPFQIESITNPQGKSIIDASGKCIDTDGGTPPKPDTQYCDQIGIFRDTLFTKQSYHIIMRTRYEDYIGEFVLHCHILDHEDQGMMENVKIAPGGNVTLGHGHLHP